MVGVRDRYYHLIAMLSRKEKRFPTYCPLAVTFDVDRLYTELIGLLPRFESLATTEANIRDRSKWFAVAADRLYTEVERYVSDPSRSADLRICVPGNVPSWWGISLTHVPDRPETNWGSSRYRSKHNGGWEWKNGLDLRYTRQLVASLPIDGLGVVRVMSLPEGGFGPTHVDCKDDSPWEVDGLASVTFLLRDGEVPMRFMAPDGRLHDVSHPVFYFKDCAPHGVPQAKSRRLLLRINGTANLARLLELMKLDEAIW